MADRYALDPDSLLSRITRAVLIATRGPLADGVPSRQLQLTIQSAVEMVTEARGEASHWWNEEFAQLLHDGREEIELPPGEVMVFNDDRRRKDPRLDPEPIPYSERLEDSPSLRDVADFSEIDKQNGWVFTNNVAAAPGLFFLDPPEFAAQVEQAADDAALRSVEDAIDERRRLTRRRSSTFTF